MNNEPVMHPRTATSINIALVLASTLWLAAGCSEPEPEPIEPLPGELEAGVAIDGRGFVSVDDGAEFILAPGAQGGFHIWVNLRLRGVSGELYVEREARRVIDDELVSRAIRQYVPVPDDALSNWWENPDAMPSFLCPAPLGIQVNDQELVFEVRVTTEDGTVMAADQMSMTVRCPEGAQAEFCLDICSGNP
jgi:hypothetical protein